MSQALLAAHQAVHVANVAAGKLPRPKKTVTIPVIIIFAVLAAIALVRKLIAVALIAVIICVGVLLYQSGALNHWVDKGKSAVSNVKTNSLAL